MNATFSIQDIYSLMDLTCLRDDATHDDIRQLIDQGNQHRVAALCVFPHHVGLIPAETSYKRATVVNFPEGNHPQHHVLQEIENVIQCTDEIDYVFPYSLYLSGKKRQALSACKEAYTLCQQEKKTFKVILETGAAPSCDVIYQMSRDVLAHGCDFLKTSTGKIAQGATIEAARAMLSAIQDMDVFCGVKISGGIRSFEQACMFMQLAQTFKKEPLTPQNFRLGASCMV